MLAARASRMRENSGFFVGRGVSHDMNSARQARLHSLRKNELRPKFCLCSGRFGFIEPGSRCGWFGICSGALQCAIGGAAIADGGPPKLDRR